MNNRDIFSIIAPVFLLVLSAFSPPVSASESLPEHQSATETVSTGDSVVVYFSLDCSDLQPYLQQSQDEMDSFIASLKQSYRSGKLKSVEIRAYSCLIGTNSNCTAVAGRRAENLADYIIGHSGIPAELVCIKETDIAWDLLLELVRKDREVPGYENAISIIRDTPLWIFDEEGRIVDGRKNRLMEAEQGRTFAYLRSNFFEQMRYASAHSYITVPEQQPAGQEPAEPATGQLPEQQETPVETPPQAAADTVDADTDPVFTPAVQSSVTGVRAEDFWETSKVWLKTNLPYWGLVVPNLAVEVRLADHWSLDIPVYYSPFTVADDYRFRTFTMQPSVRYWFKPEMKGHFLGVHVTGAAFNFATDKQFRYQDTDGAWGAGIDYGYALRFSRHWGMEFNIGVGYLWTKYETYYNIENGASCGTETLNYLGITRLGISLIYKL